jgi:hypothetical protein
MKRFPATCVSISAGFCLWIALIPAPTLAQAPINRHLAVRRTDRGYMLVGYRAEVGSRDRFILEPGMSADEARAQLKSVRWDQFVDKLEDEGVAAAGRRLWDGVLERVFVRLTRPGGKVDEVAYEKIPTRYSRDNLTRLTRAAYGPETVVVVDETDHFDYRFVWRDDALIVDAQRPGPGTIAWRIRYYIMSLTAEAAGGEGPEPKEVTVLQPMWPLPNLMESATTTQPVPGEILIPEDIGKGLKQVYPPPASQPAQP